MTDVVNKKDLCWFDENGNIVVNPKEVSVIYLGVNDWCELFLQGERVKNLVSVAIIHEAKAVPVVTTQVHGLKEVNGCEYGEGCGRIEG